MFTFPHVALFPDPIPSFPSLATLPPFSTLDGAYVRKILGSPQLHNFNVCIPEPGSLGTRLVLQQSNVAYHESYRGFQVG